MLPGKCGAQDRSHESEEAFLALTWPVSFSQVTEGSLKVMKPFCQNVCRAAREVTRRQGEHKSSHEPESLEEIVHVIVYAYNSIFASRTLAD